MMNLNTLSRRERAVAGACLLTVLMALVGPYVAQTAAYHLFADGRHWGELPHAADVLSNLGFVLMGLWGLKRLQEGAAPVPALVPTQVHQGLYRLFFTGLLVTAFGSAFYHWQPDNQGLAIDRLGMVLPFAGLLGLAAAHHVSARAAQGVLGFVLLFGGLAIAVFAVTNNAFPWALLQAMGMLALLACMLTPAMAGQASIRWGAVVACYALAKLLEAQDAAVFEWTQQLISGHSLKHLAAACAAWPLIAALPRSRTTYVAAQSTRVEARPALPKN